MSSEDLTTSSWLSLDVDEDINETSLYWDLHIFTIIEIVRLIIRLSALISNIYLIVIIIRFMKLRTTINRVIFLYAVISTGFLTSGVLVTIIARFTSVDYYTDCLLIGVEKFTEILLHFALTLLAISWYVPSYHPALNNKYPLVLKYGVGVCFLVISITATGFSIVNCSNQNAKYYQMYFTVELLCFSLCAIILIGLTILKRYKKPALDALETAYAFSIPHIVFIISALATLLSVLVLLIESQVSTYQKILFRLVYLEQISSCLDLAEPIVVLYILAKSSKHFKIAYLKCCKKNLQNYENDLDVSPTTNAGSGNNVTFHRTSENIWM
ncbi:uncharacterized protein LOC109535128 [Dendroctonus ponderosae]|uniref:G-protein coupled receptors family 1 profile domain-containing protein n=1 Tax=Dendroctonus ponderosae TaxID=77166 RepID=A0AAR5P5Y4_DENPD|nr:uncharacterized protein LOC109535128 [Dendroctonus ponderosae]